MLRQFISVVRLSALWQSVARVSPQGALAALPRVRLRRARRGVLAAGSTRHAFGGVVSEQFLYERNRDLLEMCGVFGTDRCSHRTTVTGHTRYGSPLLRTACCR